MNILLYCVNKVCTTITHPTRGGSQKAVEIRAMLYSTSGHYLCCICTGSLLREPPQRVLQNNTQCRQYSIPNAFNSFMNIGCISSCNQ